MKGEEWILALEDARRARDRAGMVRVLGESIEALEAAGMDMASRVSAIAMHRMWSAVLLTYRNVFGWWAEEKGKPEASDVWLLRGFERASNRMEEIVEELSVWYGAKGGVGLAGRRRI